MNAREERHEIIAIIGEGVTMPKDPLGRQLVERTLREVRRRIRQRDEDAGDQATGDLDRAIDCMRSMERWCEHGIYGQARTGLVNKMTKDQCMAAAMEAVRDSVKAIRRAARALGLELEG